MEYGSEDDAANILILHAAENIHSSPDTLLKLDSVKINLNLIEERLKETIYC